MVPCLTLVVAWIYITYPASMSAQSLPDTTMCRGEYLELKARNDYEIYAWSPREAIIWSVNEKANLSPGQTQVYTVRARRRLSTEYVLDGNFDEGGRGATSELARVGPASLQTGTTAILTNSNIVRLATSACPELSGRADAQYLAVYGERNRTVDAWCQRVPVEKGKIYNFRATTSTLRAATVGRIGFTVNGVLINRFVDPYPSDCTWRAYGVDYTAVADEEVTVCVQIKSPEENAALEALDEISFREYDVDYLDTFELEVLDAPIPSEETRIICENTRFREYGLDLGPGEVGTASFAMPNGCDSLIEITVVGAKTLYTYDTLRQLCIGDEISVAGQTHLVIQDTSLFKLLRTGAGCDSVVATTLEVFDRSNVAIEVATPSCDATTTSVTVARLGTGASLTWSDEESGSYRRDNLPTGQRTGLLVENGSGCSVYVDINVPVASSPQLSLTTSRPPSCPASMDGGARIDVSTREGEAIDLSLFNSRGQTIASTQGLSLTVDALGEGSYYFSAVDPLACADTLAFVLESIESPKLEILGDTFVLRGLPAEFSLVGAEAYAADRVVWSFDGSLLPEPTTTNSGMLSLKLASSGWLTADLLLDNGCIVSQRRFVRREDPRRSLFPEAFSPNGDERNDGFGVVAHRGVARLHTLQVYDRWGALIYAGGDASARWLGEDAAVGTYVYVAEIVFLDGSRQRVSGIVDLLR